VPIVFVHGFPETSDIWRPLREILDRSSEAVALPGFGAPLPTGFTATKDAYADWLGETLRRIDEPVDVVGHDVGALLTKRVASSFDVPLRSWVVDVPDIFHPRFSWPERVRDLQRLTQMTRRARLRAWPRRACRASSRWSSGRLMARS
jgi:pimeloyl-ACP methyl ester carboxylesterase